MYQLYAYCQEESQRDGLSRMKGAFTTPYEAKPLATNFACSLSPFEERVIPSAGSAVTRLQAAESPSKTPLASRLPCRNLRSAKVEKKTPMTYQLRRSMIRKEGVTTIYRMTLPSSTPRSLVILTDSRTRRSVGMSKKAQVNR